MAPEELPLRCLAVSVTHDATGEIDSLEFEAFMNEIVGPGLWISTREWLFVEPPILAVDQVTVPVALPEALAIKAIIADLTNQPNRIVGDHAITPGETRKWRWAAFQIAPNPEGQGRFPWERASG